ncbi:hypothetical protein SRIMM317S_03975 [Streptomyces rimosus subsp. rimosus]
MSIQEMADQAVRQAVAVRTVSDPGLESQATMPGVGEVSAASRAAASAKVMTTRVEAHRASAIMSAGTSSASAPAG